MAIREYRPLTLDERVAVLESELSALTAQQAELSALLRSHMALEEQTTREVLGGIALIERRMSKWHGIALGVALAVSALWSLLVAGVSWMR